MKTTITIYVIFLMAISSIIASPIRSFCVQPAIKGVEGNFAFSFVRSHRQGQGITISWGAHNYEGVAGFIVQKTYSDPGDEYAVWEEVAYINATAERTYRALDSMVFAGFNNYRVIAIMNDGSEVTSPITTVRIVSHK